MKIGSTPIHSLSHPVALEKGVSLYVKREDLNHEHMSGNKLRKLKYNLLEARKRQQKTILTFGGAFSNHIYATAAAGKAYGFQTIAIIRGEEHLPLNPTLQFARDQGMLLYYLDRTRYRSKHMPIILDDLRERFGDFYLIPEGGTNELAIQGCQEILSDDELQFDYYALSVGTGGTIGGIIQRLKGKQLVLGFSALKGGFLEEEIKNLFKQYNLPQFTNWDIHNDYHFGAYAKATPDLMAFIKNMESAFDLPLDPVYTAKALYGLLDMIEQGAFPEGSSLLFIHTGGLQGRAGFGL